MSPIRVTWEGALAWRLRQHFLEPTGTGSAVDVVRRLGAVKAEPDQGAELAIRIRQRHSSAGQVSEAIAEGRIIQAFAFRGAVHLMTAVEAGVYLALRAASRMWELPSWQTYYGLAPSDWPAFREAVRDALSGGPLTRQELGVAITALPRYRGLRMAFENKTWTLLKALFWQGDVAFGPPRGGRATFQRLDRNPHWAGIPSLDEAGPNAVEKPGHAPSDDDLGGRHAPAAGGTNHRHRVPPRDVPAERRHESCESPKPAPSGRPSVGQCGWPFSASRWRSSASSA